MIKFLPAGFFNKKQNQEFSKKFKDEKVDDLEKVDWVTGCSMLVNLKKFSDKEIFDKTFLYFEEFDLCKSVIDRGENVYTSKYLKIDHLGFQSSLGSSSENKDRANRLRSGIGCGQVFIFIKKTIAI